MKVLELVGREPDGNGYRRVYHVPVAQIQAVVYHRDRIGDFSHAEVYLTSAVIAVDVASPEAIGNAFEVHAELARLSGRYKGGETYDVMRVETSAEFARRPQQPQPWKGSGS